tara:strand:- start:316 stop:651 length:336 start_codon:yes stop_codon:yes gene_type:complete
MVRKALVNISDCAKKHLIKIAIKNNTKLIKFYVKGSGCSGFQYAFKPVKYMKGDDTVDLSGDIKLVVDNKSLLHVIGTTISWEDNIMGQAFVFDNPNAVSRCGCGTSFSID